MISAAARGWAPNTQRAFLSDLRLWHDWSRRSGVATAAAEASDVAGYVRALSGQDQISAAARATPQRAAAAIARYLVHIG